MIEFLYRALEAEFGIAISTGDPATLRQKLYAARRKNPDPELDNLSILIPPAPGEVWIIKKGQPDARKEG